MTSGNTASHRRSRPAGPFSLPVVLMLMAVLLAASFGLLRLSDTQAATATLVVQMPGQVALGEPFEVQLLLENGSGVAAYETRLLMNTARASLRSVDHAGSTFAEIGREVQTLGPVDIAGGFAIGAYSLPGSAGERGAEGTVRLATLTIVPNQSGTLLLTLSSFAIAAPDGQRLEVSVPQTSFSVQVIGGQS
jgi:hypothetical protein